MDERAGTLKEEARNDRAMLFAAAQRGDAEILREFAQRGLRVLEIRGRFRETCLHWAAKNNFDEIFDIVRDEPLDLFNARDEADYTALDVGARSGNVEICRLLLEKGVDISTGPHFTINLAARSGSVPMIELMHEFGEDVIGTAVPGYPAQKSKDS